MGRTFSREFFACFFSDDRLITCIVRCPFSSCQRAGLRSSTHHARPQQATDSCAPPPGPRKAPGAPSAAPSQGRRRWRGHMVCWRCRRPGSSQSTPSCRHTGRSAGQSPCPAAQAKHRSLSVPHRKPELCVNFTAHSQLRHRTQFDPQQVWQPSSHCVSLLPDVRSTSRRCFNRPHER